MIKRVYVDTSVVGGYFDKEFSADTKPLFDNLNKGGVVLLVSDLLEAELLRAPSFVMEFFKSLPKKHGENVRLTPEANDLADKYIKAKVVGKTSRADCQHISIATLNHADVLVSWNFKHIVNLDRIRGYNGINFQFGYKMIEIRTPKEIMNYEKD